MSSRKAVRRIHGLLRRDPHGPGVSLHRHHHAQRRAAPHAAARLGLPCSTRPTARTSAPSASKRRRCGSSRPPAAIRSRSACGTHRAARTRCASRSGSAAFGEARLAIAALFGGISRLKHVFVFDEDIDIRNDLQVEWALGTRFQADQDLMVLSRIPGHVDGPVAARAADRRQVRLRLHQAVRPRRRNPADPQRRQGLQGPGALPEHRAGAVDGADVLRRPGRSRSAATTAARSPAGSTSCGRTASSAATATAAIILRRRSPASPPSSATSITIPIRAL